MKHNNMIIKPTIMRGILQIVGEERLIKRNNKPNLRKLQILIKCEDGQMFYPEFLNSKVDIFYATNLSIGDYVEVDIVFRASEKQNKIYNNLYIQNIKKL